MMFKKNEAGDISSESSTWIKSLYRKIATLTHPDKLSKELPDQEKEALIDSYKEAASAYKSGDYAKLISISVDLDLSTSDVGEGFIKNIEDRNAALKIEIKTIKGSILWAWESITDNAQRNTAISFGKSRGWSLKD